MAKVPGIVVEERWVGGGGGMVGGEADGTELALVAARGEHRVSCLGSRQLLYVSRISVMTNL